MGNLIRAEDQHVLASLLQIRATGLPVILWQSCTSSALSPEVVTRTVTATRSHTGAE